MLTMVTLVLLGGWSYADLASDPPAAPRPAFVPPSVRPLGGQTAGVESPPAPVVTPPALARAVCNCGGDGCSCSPGAKCSVIDGGCEPGVRRRPVAAIAPLPVPAVVVVSTVAPPTRWQLHDAAGKLWEHEDKGWLETFVAGLNAALAPPAAFYSAPVYQPAATFYSAPVVTTYAPPVYTVAPVFRRFGFGRVFGAGASSCGPGGCP